MDGVITDTMQLEGQTPSLVFAYVPTSRELLPVTLETTETGYWLATNPHVLVHGVGDTPAEALAEFVEMALDHYEDYTADRDRLSPSMLEELDYLTRIFSAPETV